MHSDAKSYKNNMAKTSKSKEFIAKQGRLRGNTEEARQMGKVGGKKSGEARRQKRTYREIFEALKDELIKTKGGKQVTLQEAAVQGVYKKAIGGDIQAMKLLLSMAGELETSMDDFSQTINITFANKEMADKFNTIIERGHK